MKNSEFAMRRVWGPIPKYPLVMAYRPPSNKFITIAGPCSVEDKAQITALAKLVAGEGATHLRGGVFRAGTYPGNKFGPIDLTLIQAFSEAAGFNGLDNIIEVLDYSDRFLSIVSTYADCVQVGARQMQNYTLLRTIAKLGKPVFLKRNMGATMDEWLGSAEHLLTAGCEELYLIERGSSSHMNHVRHELSISIVPAVKAICDIPVIVDAAHGTGRRDLVEPMALAGVAAGARGILVEVHQTPDKSLSDPDQAITPVDFKVLMSKVKRVHAALKEINP